MVKLLTAIMSSNYYKNGPISILIVLKGIKNLKNQRPEIMHVSE